jgi:putative ABC transport system permease protein
MNEVFGIPAESLLVFLVAAAGIALAAVGWLALRNPILVKLGVRNVGRRRGRSALIVLGLMLGTTVIAAALTTGDTMDHTIRSTAIATLGSTDEIVSAEGAMKDIPGELGDATGTGYLAASSVREVERAVAGSGLVDGVTGAIVEEVALQAPAQGQTEPTVVLFAADPARMAGFGSIEGTHGAVALDDLLPGEAYLNADAADSLHVGPGGRIVLYAVGRPRPLRVRDVVRYDGTGTADEALLLPLAQAQELLGREALVKHVLVSNRGGPLEGAPLTDRVSTLLERSVGPLGLEVATSKQDAIDDADETGNAFMAFFTTFGSFSMAAGILLIFLIFVMLAAERRGELGIARAVGTRRSHLVQLFVFEGLAYDLLAALVGAVLGAVVAFGMVFVMASAFGTADEDAGPLIQFAVTPRSLLIAALIGVLLTLAVVAFSAWRVSRMTISSAIRNLPDPPSHRGRRRWFLAGLGVAVGLLLALSGYSAGSATPLMLGVSLVIVGLVPVARLLRVSDRIAYTAAGLVLVVIWMLPWRAWEAVFGDLAMDFSTWIVSGLMVVVGAVWVIVYNADLILGSAMAVLGRVRRLAPVLRISMAYPLAARFRTGTTLAMFTLVVFTLVTGAASSGSFNAAMSNPEKFGGGFDVRASVSGGAPIADVREALASTPGARPQDYRIVAAQSVLAVDATQTGTKRPAETYVARGLDDAFLGHTTFGMGAVARGYSSAREVWNAVRTRPGLAVVDSLIVPRRDNFGFAAGLPDFRLSGFYYDDGDGFAPIPVVVRDPQTQKELRVSVIGILQETAPFEMVGLSTSQRTLETAFRGRVDPTVGYFALAPGVEPQAAADRLERTFLANGMEAESIEQVTKDVTESGRTFNRLIMGFMGLGLLVGVAALGVISARSVVERRQQIGVLRAIGFRRGMVQATFLLESSFVALTSIVVGTGLGLLLAYNIVDDTQRQSSWYDLTLVVPWGTLAIVFGVVYAVALLTTVVPAVRASRVYPAEALRYQ